MPGVGPTGNQDDEQPLELKNSLWEASSCRNPATICEPMSEICPGKHPEHMNCSAYFCVIFAAAPVVRTVSPNFIEFDEWDFVVKGPLDESVARRPCTDDVVSDAGKCMLWDANVPGLARDRLPPITPADLADFALATGTATRPATGLATRTLGLMPFIKILLI